LWLFLMGGLFMAVVMFFPNGLAGLWDQHARKLKFMKRFYDDTPPEAEKIEPTISEPAVATEPAAKKEKPAKMVNMKGAKA